MWNLHIAGSMSIKGYNHFRKIHAYNQAILFKDIYPVEMRTYVQRVLAALFLMAKKLGPPQ